LIPSLICYLFGVCADPKLTDTTRIVMNISEQCIDISKELWITFSIHQFIAFMLQVSDE